MLGHVYSSDVSYLKHFFPYIIATVDINDCNPDPCVNGDCTDEVDGYSCVCVAGYAGDDCDGKLSS